MMNDLDTLRPEVREAAEEIDEILGSFGNEEWKAIRAELLRLAMIETDALIALDCEHDWQVEHERAEKAEAELAALKNENAQLRDVLADRDMDREMAAHANRELAALKARIAGGWLCGVSNDKCRENFDAAIYCLPSRFRGKRVRLVVEE